MNKVKAKELPLSSGMSLALWRQKGLHRDELVLLVKGAQIRRSDVKSYSIKFCLSSY